jgi:Rod binding domain-containing protein
MMSAATGIQGAMALAQSAPVAAPKAAPTAAGTTKIAQQFEGVLMSQMLNEMFEGVKTDGMFGGGEGEEMFRSLMVDEYGKQIAQQGGMGLTAAVTRQLLSHQETAQ